MSVLTLNFKIENELSNCKQFFVDVPSIRKVCSIDKKTPCLWEMSERVAIHQQSCPAHMGPTK